MRAGSKLGALLVLALVRTASAEPSPADQTFQRGRTLMAKKQFAEACAAFEQSQQLDPELGTLFNLADCDSQLGKVATAWKIFREIALTDPNQDRRKLSAAAAKELEPKLPHLLVAVASAPPGVAMQLDGGDATALVGVATPVDIGRHAIVVTAPGFHEFRGKADATLGAMARISVTLEPLEPLEPPPLETLPKKMKKPPIEDPATPPEAPPARRGKLPMIVGVATLGVGVTFGAVAYTEYHDALDCTTCTPSDTRSTSHTAVVLGDVSTALVVVGAVAAVGGFYLWHTSGSSALVAPAVGPDHAGAVVFGRF